MEFIYLLCYSMRGCDPPTRTAKWSMSRFSDNPTAGVELLSVEWQPTKLVPAFVRTPRSQRIRSSNDTGGHCRTAQGNRRHPPWHLVSCCDRCYERCAWCPPNAHHRHRSTFPVRKQAFSSAAPCHPGIRPATAARSVPDSMLWHIADPVTRRSLLIPAAIRSSESTPSIAPRNRRRTRDGDASSRSIWTTTLNPHRNLQFQDVADDHLNEPNTSAFDSLSMAEADVEPSTRSIGDFHDNALAE